MTTKTIKQNNRINPAEEHKQVLAEIYKRYQQDPVFFVEHCLGHYTWGKQREILMSIANYPRTAVRASHSVSKTFTAAEAGTWFFNMFPDSKLITTAPTGRQVEKLLWPEIGKNYRTSRFKLDGECLTLTIKTSKEEHYALGFSTDKANSSEGFHAPELMFIFDEAKGIPQWAWDAAVGSMAGGLCKFLVISTTDGVQPGEHYHKIFNDAKEKKLWNHIHIKASDSPYVTGESFRYIEIPDPARPDIFRVKYISPDKLRMQLASPQWIADCKTTWGKDSVLFMTKVEGEIVDSTGGTIIKLSQVYKMHDNYNNPDFNRDGVEEIGVDVAVGNEDSNSTVMYKRKGMVITGREIISPQDLPSKEQHNYIADKVKIFAGYKKDIRIKIDDTGCGGGVRSILQHDGYCAMPVHFGQEAIDSDKYPNAISEMWYETSLMLDQIACPQIDKLQAELVNRKQKSLDKKGRQCIESKKEYKKRGFHSPDDADAFLLTFYNPAGAGANYTEIAESINNAPTLESMKETFI